MISAENFVNYIHFKIKNNNVRMIYLNVLFIYFPPFNI